MCEEVRYEDANLTAYVIANLGSRCIGNNMKFLTMALYPIIFAVGLCGNGLTVALITGSRSMHQATNYYICSLALSDLVQLLLGLPLELHKALGFEYPFLLGPLVCKGRVFGTEMASYASVLTITAFSVERWLAICFPFKVQLFSKFSRAIRVIGVIWCLAVLNAVPVASLATINRLRLPPHLRNHSSQEEWIEGTEFCALEHGAVREQTLVITWSFGVFFCLPLLVIGLLYLHIAVNISTTPLLPQGARQRKRRRDVIRMLVGVVICFFVCWCPYHAQRLMTIYVDWSDFTPFTHLLFNAFFYVSGFFYYANSALNPLLYSLLSRRFRHELIRHFCPGAVVQRFLGSSGSVQHSRYFFLTEHKKQRAKEKR